MPDRINDAVMALKSAKAQSLNYYDATRELEKQGFSEQEIALASDRFPYNQTVRPDPDDSKLNPALDQAFAKAVVHEEAVDYAKQELHKDIAMTVFGGNSLVGDYYGNKAMNDLADLKDLEKNGKYTSTDQNASQLSKQRLFQRNRSIRYYALASLVPLVILMPYFISFLRTLPALVNALAHHHDSAAFAGIGLYLWLVCGYLAYICMAATLFLAHKESTIVKVSYAVMAVDMALFVLFAILFRSAAFLLFGFITLIPAFWISRRVGLLSRLS